ncbi:substrate-binding domain-containing protein [Marinomonas primoryensis]|jgi:ribose transport system substrate-binding protein|uniref:ABC transporter substrate-binding protein n=1 Tax=Marinomonas primoryensis TaxID=178399 RepID=A0A859CVK2_9GAMM|nr:substrate-binding domain-containing protein [Marinomonas primoryensis]QKK80526.1 ABC transporter substrate-binding protein [Marinomonas primoryensis]|tara:strand:+ start:199 stop:1167 length:969 start_codon:yes stop_codon:yes gene_type:complete
MKYKNNIMRVIAVFTMLFAFVGSSYAAKYKVGVSVPSADHGWTAGLLWWANKAAADLKAKEKDIEFYVVASSSGSKQVGDVEDLMIKGIDALVILPHNPATLQKVIEEAYDEGIYTVVVDRELAHPAQNVFIAGDNEGLGRVGAQWLAKEMSGKGNIVVIEGMQIPINKQRVDAFNDVIAGYPNIKILDSQPGDWSTQKALAVMENFLQKHPEIDAVWCQDDDMLKGVLKAIEESGRTDIKTVLGGAGSKDIIEMIQHSNKMVRATVTYSPSMIASGIALAVHGVKNEKLGYLYHEPSRVILGADLVTKENAAEYYFKDAAY